MKRIVGRMKSSYKSLAKRKLAFMLVAPTLTIFVGVTLYPLLYSLQLSFYSWNLIRPSLEKSFVGLGNYRKILYDSIFWRSLKITFFFTGATIILQFLIGSGLALLLSAEFKGKSLFRSLVLIPLAIAPIAIGLTWRWLLDPSLGVVNYFLSLVGIAPRSWLGSPSLALFTVIMIDVWHLTPFVVIILLAGLQALPQELYDVAAVDGATWWQTFRYVTIPLLKPTILVVLLLRTIDSFKAFPKIFVLTKGGPGRATEILGLLIYRVTFKDYYMGYGAALSYVLVFFVMAISLFYIKLLSSQGYS